MSASADVGPLPDTRELYLTLLKQALLGTLWAGDEIGSAIRPTTLARRVVLAGLRRRRVTLARLVEYDPESIDEGRGWPQRAATMIGSKRLDNVHRSVEDVIRHQIPGDLIEAGVWRGGASILMRGVLRAHGIEDRRVWVADSFDGLPPPDRDGYPADQGDTFYEFRSSPYRWISCARTSSGTGCSTSRWNFSKGGSATPCRRWPVTSGR